jgi:hypothetical protein
MRRRSNAAPERSVRLRESLRQVNDNISHYVGENAEIRDIQWLCRAWSAC